MSTNTQGSDVQVSLEFTPNPNTLKFVTNQKFLERGAANFTDKTKTDGSPLAQSIFGIEGVSAVMIGTHFVTITKSPTGDWDVIAEKVPETIEGFLKAGKKPFADTWQPEAPKSTANASDAEIKIREVLDTEIRPAVAMDGGDITFDKYENGIVYLHLQGACSSCPSSIATLKMGVETRLKEIVPEIKEVVQV